MHVRERHAIKEPLPRLVSLARDGHGHATERLPVTPARNMQLVNQEEQNVQLAYGSETPGDPAQPFDELPRDVSVELEHRHQLPKTARRDADAMQRPHVALFHLRQRLGEAIDSSFKEL
jgi:hypothetical protein